MHINNLVKKYSSIDASVDIARDYSKRALEYLDKHFVDSDEKTQFKKLSDSLTLRYY